MSRMVVVVPQMVHWTGRKIDDSFTRLVQYDNKPEAYGYLRSDNRGWVLYVVSKDEVLYGLNSLAHHNLIAVLRTAKEDFMVLMTPRDFVVFRHEVEPYIFLEVIRPYCLVASIAS